MKSSKVVEARFEKYRKMLERIGQEQVLRFWPELQAPERMALLQDLESLRYDMLPGLPDLIEKHVKQNICGLVLPKVLEPAVAIVAGVSRYAEALTWGIERIRQGKVAALTVAGGQGTRLGVCVPKGMLGISPVRHKSLFQLFAEAICSAGRCYGSQIRWYVMTSPANDVETRAFFETHGYFGLSREDVVFFAQGVMPVFERSGRLILDEKHRLSLSPDGHGGTLLALKRSGALEDMARRGIEEISYFQVDNPLVRPIDPLFIGLHAIGGCEFSSKSIPKADDLERVGNFVIGDGKLQIIEYSDLPETLARERTAEGRRKFDAANIAVHVISREFIERLTADEKRFGLPWHRAEKRVPYMDESGTRVRPDEPNAVKLETFIFDAIGLARKPLLLETIRSEEFSPVKNERGVDSVETARRDMIRRAAAWLEKVGCDVPKRPDGEPDAVLEISPLLASDADELRSALKDLPVIASGMTLYLE